MKYAIVKIGSLQYTLEEGKEYSIPKFVAEVGKMKMADVLAIGENDTLTLGQPMVDKAIVEVEVLGQEKGEKVQSRIYKAKARYRRTRGIRKQVTRFKVLNIKL
jgi:large subunit ribosomal protein L21